MVLNEKMRWLFAPLLIVSFQLAAQTPEAVPDSLTLAKAVALALENHPSLQAATAGVRAASAVVKQVRANLFPNLSFTASGSHIDGAFVFNPSFPPRQQKYDNYTGGLQLQQLVFDFGRTSGRMSASRHLVQAANDDYYSVRDQVATNVQLAYFSVISAQRVVQVNEEAVAQADKHLQRAKAFYSVGRRPQIDVTKSEVDLANADVNLIRARNQLRVARVELENAMGVRHGSTFAVADTFQVRSFTMSLDSAKARAMVERPELRAARARVQSTQSLVSAAWRQHLPSLSATGSITWNGFDFPLASRWSAGATLSFPLFQGFAVVAQVEQAQAGLDAAQANTTVLSEGILLDVEENYLTLREAEERIGATRKLVAQAEENLKITEARYNSGVGSAIEITDAQVVLSNARITNIQALFDYNGSLVRLRRAMGRVEVR
jgi:outer membrane protein TolC